MDEVSAAAGQMHGKVRLNAPRLALATFVLPVLAAFALRYPAVTVELVADDALTDIVAAGCDLGIRLGEGLDGDMTTRPLGGEPELMAVATPAYLAAAGMPAHPAKLCDHGCLNYRLPRDGSLYAWAFEQRGRPLVVAVDGPLVTDDHAVLLDGVRQGLGLAYLMDIQVRNLVESGDLVRVLSEWSPRFSGFHLYRPMRREPSPAVDAFPQALAERHRLR